MVWCGGPDDLLYGEALKPSAKSKPSAKPDTLAVTVVVGAIGLAWFAFYLWSVLGGPFVW
jgi:hypothetical protein